MVADVALSRKIDYVTIFKEIINLEGQTCRKSKIQAYYANVLSLSPPLHPFRPVTGTKRPRFDQIYTQWATKEKKRRRDQPPTSPNLCQVKSAFSASLLVELHPEGSANTHADLFMVCIGSVFLYLKLLNAFNSSINGLTALYTIIYNLYRHSILTLKFCTCLVFWQ